MRRYGKYAGLFLMVVYAFFFASTNLFYHTHQGEDFKLVHSHPFSGAGHSHTSNQVLLIDAVDSSIYQESPDVAAPDYILTPWCVEIAQCLKETVESCLVTLFSLRAPPAVL